jgi:hypothetical protein
MSRYSPSYVPASLSQRPPSFGEELADAIESYRGRQRQDQVDAQADAVTAAKMREAGIRPVAPGAPETPGTRLRGLLAALGIGHGADGQPTAPRATMDARVTDAPTGGPLPMQPGQSIGGPLGQPELGQHIGGFAGGTLAGALERQGAQPGAHGPMPSLPPTMQQPAPPPLQPQTMAPQGASLMVGAFNPATGTFNSGAQPLAPVQAVVDDPPPAVQPPAPPSRAQRQYEPLSRGYEIETEDSRTAREQALAEALYQQKAQHDAAERARRAGVYGGAVNDPALAGVLAEDAATGRTLISDRTDRAQLSESSRHSRTTEGLAALQERRMAATRGQGGTGKGAAAPRSTMATDGERKAAALIPKAEAAASALDRFSDVSWWDQNRSHLPMIGNAVSSGPQQRLNLAADQFLTAILRPESGATITPAELDQARRQFVPMPGDTKQTLDLKREARTRAIQQLRDMGGRAVKGAPQGAPQAAPASAADLYDALRAEGKSHEEATAEALARAGGSE